MLHMKPLLVGEVKICVEVGMRSCKVGGTFAKSDSNSRLLFHEEWNGLLEQVQHRQEITNEIYYQSVEKFLNSLYEKRKQWAARYSGLGNTLLWVLTPPNV